ncbi:MAG TPA: hypothetical protein VMD30_05915, partial [Tepidisphaeraceae bacterium]|nr:hypothetical protein [Tepidisphaeraceae bacterium]
MNLRVRPVLCLLCLTTLPAALARADDTLGPPSVQQSPSSAVLLADRIEGLALSMPSPQSPPPFFFHYIDALYSAAAELNPTEARYYRTLFDVRSHLNDLQGQIDALNSYLQCPGNGDDRFAETQLITCYAARMETAEKRMAYLHGIIGKTVLPASVRSYAAYLCALVLKDRAENQAALKMLDDALQIDPLNGEATSLKYSMSPDATPVERVGMLLAMLRANPRNAEISTALGGVLADEGLVNESLSWYVSAAQLYDATGRPRSPAWALGAAAEFYLGNQPKPAVQVSDGYLSAYPYDAGAWNVRLAIEKDTGKSPDNFDALSRLCVRDLDNNLQMIRHAGLGIEDATTRPADSSNPPASEELTVPDLSGDRDILVQLNDAHLADKYIAAVEAEAWVRIYFRHDTGSETAKLLSELTVLPGDSDPTVASLEGWNYYIKGKKAEAKEKFSAVADRDPYAALGLIELMAGDPAQKANVAGAAKKLMGAHPWGPVAAVLFGALHQYGAEVVPQAHSDSVQAAMDAFPMDWLNILGEPEKFYGISVDPMNTEISYGDPIIVRLTLENFNDYDITIGDDGALTPEMLINAQFRGLVNAAVPDLRVEQFWQRTVLPARQKAVQYVRLDRGAVAEDLAFNPDRTLDLAFILTSNPIATRNGVISGPGGYQVQSSSLIERQAIVFGVTPDSIDKLCTMAAKGKTAQERMSAIEACAAMVRQVVANQGIDPTTKQQMIARLISQLEATTGDSDPHVAAWAQTLLALVSSGQHQTQVVQSMISSGKWYVRFLGIYATLNMQDHQAAQTMVEQVQLPGETDAAVKEFAQAAADDLA